MANVQWRFQIFSGEANQRASIRMCSDSEQQGWRYTWEAQSHIPTLRLTLFPNDKTLNPSLQCKDLAVDLHSSHSFLTLTASFLSLRVPLPAVLVDGDSPVAFRPLSDHIEVKLLLLLPVDHPIFSLIPPNEQQQAPNQLSATSLQFTDGISTKFLNK